MYLYEFTTSWTGESYVRAYAWAHDPEEAARLFMEKNPGQTFTGVRVLFGSDDGPHATVATDHGFPEDYGKRL